MAKTSLSKNGIYNLIKRGEFPAPIKIGASSRWAESGIDRWMQRTLEER